MNKSLKTSAALLTLSLALTTGAVSAAPFITTLPATKAPQAAAANQTFSIEVNGTAIAEHGFQTAGAKEPLIPLRSVAEALGFTITWNPKTKAVDLSKGTTFTTVKSGEDRYAVNKMNKSLGTVPVTKADKLFVPVSFVSEVLNQNISVEGQQIMVSSAVEHQNETGVITAINQDKKYPSVQIKGTGTAGLVLNLGEDTVIAAADGTKLDIADLQIGMTIEAEHANFATLSLPPQTPAYAITVQDSKLQKDTLGTQGIVEEVLTSEDGSLSIRIKGTGLTDTSQSEVVLRINADTAIVNESGEAVSGSSLVQGAQVIGFYSPVLTRSLPPIGTALKVVVETVQQ
ncbi:copper amine oxidase [Paenibacillus sp. PK3_47]|uniref:copper amine oxidase N-terminal domain-containing protein n=1 Tax=Paenibacillus sp. PK3_47 TaxID=2072642 RepID=UPI00201E5052|nr:copper amine oxidase N-terminal domain-containing protein [Paenibacillus sp. PK3_47]UQZ34024.1 copper amine oxidase [Paenibacillus sp. PK3_47]